eukprot:scaffold648010_cov47-Prasinocladus_malaysianus.AAC.3
MPQSPVLPWGPQGGSKCTVNQRQHDHIWALRLDLQQQKLSFWRHILHRAYPGILRAATHGRISAYNV